MKRRELCKLNSLSVQLNYLRVKRRRYRNQTSSPEIMRFNVINSADTICLRLHFKVVEKLSFLFSLSEMLSARELFNMAILLYFNNIVPRFILRLFWYLIHCKGLRHCSSFQ